MINFLINLFKLPEFFIDRFLTYLYLQKVKRRGKCIKLHPSSSVYFGLNNLVLGSNISIPRYAHIFCTDAKLSIGNNVIFGPSPTIVTGDHRIDLIGTFIVNSDLKLEENDKEVVIGDDVWVGANVTILKGSIIDRGSVIAAGAVVNKKFPPYSIIGGVPARLIKFRFSIDEIIEHEILLYPENKRLLKQDLINQRNYYSNENINNIT